ncbi:hypothetical protein PSA7680_01666 [Pseudoruegeria aquimaris]|uniref:Plant Basic Secretory Protein n=1 Tax=Pseudoruegeria aquimaris TaxID=393663 RepID=A0A1Y5SAG5_9RHOB|nr:hypothetical protein [Pseudoruegeria aquimaris]SLN35073.1 hypothetical protein PSA7680_01666 [Pseudoruegeria aquimaris]
MRALLPLLLLAACTIRPLTPNEAAFTEALTGESLDAAPIRLVTNDFIGSVPYSRPVRPRTTCREKILPPPEGSREEVRTAGMVLFNHVHLNPDFAPEDLMPGYPERINLAAAMFLAHEMVHVWQWQNRETTGYHPLKAAAEHRVEDPYLFEIGAQPDFTAFGYEQQASLVEEFVCCAALDPEGARTARLRALLRQAMPLTLSRLDEAEIHVPWPDLEPEGICQ